MQTSSSLDGLSDKAIKELVKEKADAEVQNNCIKPLEQFAGPGSPHATISTTEDYKETLTRLIEITESRVDQHSAPKAAMMTSVAQRVHPGIKINKLTKIPEGACIMPTAQEPPDAGLSTYASY
ncbi:uncharacterized protein HD556DRAFT_817408 [Suillus plorans]|uniref:Uncharacterized protein n=1 Tax=Suillus plorans TaxID=116603 RepID=A0A9P7AGV0_9AGAM|nr:uncharacterized protein HD556DRAFT_817408 [Suillus plorans]KAG1789271.1 hypothetical protein HD556DRAFT_817408 [Suillus plorans]